MVKPILVSVLALSMIAICGGWVSIWLLKPTNLWTRRWKSAEDIARPTVFGYYCLNFAVFTLPVIVLAILGQLYLNLMPKLPPRGRQAKSSTTGFSNPVTVNNYLGVLSIKEILAVSLFLVFLAWTFYSRISSDFKKLTPTKSLKLSLWQLKYLRVATRFGLLAEACLALLLLPILRGLTLFKLLGIQFEASVRYHTWLGTLMILLATVHGVSTELIWGVSHHIQHEVWRWQKTGRIYLAGEIALVIGLVIWITSLPQIRRKRFEIFYFTHHLYILFFLFFLFHAGDRHFYAVFPGIFLFGIDKLLRIVQARPTTCVVAARVFPNKTVELTLPKDPSLRYMPTSSIYIKVPSISRFEWHPFSLTSSSNVDNEKLTLLIKCGEGWTGSLYDMIQAEFESGDNHVNCIPIATEGPYGPATLDFLRYDCLILIAGGIGITPFLSLLKEIDSAQSNARYRFPSRIQLIYIMKNCHDLYLLESLSSLLLQRPTKRFQLKLKAFVTREDGSNVTVRELSDNTSLVRTVNFDECSDYPVSGLDHSVWLAAILASACLVFLVVLAGLNHAFIPSGKEDGAPASKKMVVASEKRPSKEKTPSSEVDLLLLASFFAALVCSTAIAIIRRRLWMKKTFQAVIHNRRKASSGQSVSETKNIFDEHEVHFGGRPNFQDIFDKFRLEADESNIGVIVCGPETMKASVASLCKLKSQGLRFGSKGKKPHFNFHSLNFAL